MAFPFKRILTAIDFDENLMVAVDLAAQFARQNDGMVFLLHVVPMITPPAGMPVEQGFYKAEENLAKDKLKSIAGKHLHAVKYELLTHIGDPAATIVRAEKSLAADVVIMATHGRRGFSRVFLGSTAEMVLRESSCPVLTVRHTEPDRNLVGRWMASSPVTATPEEKLSAVEAKMKEGGFRSMPVLKEGRVVGIVTDRDLRRHVGYLEHTEVKMAMIEEVITINRETTISEAARLLRERKIGALPVVEEGKLVGIISNADILEALTSDE
jgi:nucleotide-binding universal stress UspA family protein/predicted transcriptional regulator